MKLWLGDENFFSFKNKCHDLYQNYSHKIDADIIAQHTYLKKQFHIA